MSTKKPTDAELKKVQNAAIRTVIDQFKALAPHLRGEYLTLVATMAISAMHGTFGKKFTSGYLAAATASLDEKETIVLREPNKH